MKPDRPNTMPYPLLGGCLCGRIRYRVLHVPIDAGYCHCRLCQHSAGAPVQAWATVARGSFEYSQGKPAHFASGAHSRREFCRHFGTQLLFCSEAEPTTLDFTLASLDHPDRIAPAYHIWTGSKIRWLHINDDLPQYAQNQP
jgi:hypothetical protein